MQRRGDDEERFNVRDRNGFVMWEKATWNSADSLSEAEKESVLKRLFAAMTATVCAQISDKRKFNWKITDMCLEMCRVGIQLVFKYIQCQETVKF